MIFYISDLHIGHKAVLHFGSFHVHSNIGEEVLFMMKQEKAYNAGCMINGYAPCTLEELEQNNHIFQKSVLG